MEFAYVGYYSLFVFFIYAFIRHADGLRKRKRAFESKVFYFLAFLIYAFDSYFRGDRGTDTLAYREHYEWMQGFFSVDEIPEGIYQFEAGYNFIVLLLIRLGVDFDWFKFIVGAFGYLALSRIADSLGVLRSSVFLFTTLSGFMFFSYNGVRQWIALLLFYLGLYLFQRHRYASFVGGGVLAFLFHKSAVIPVAVSMVSLLAERLPVSRAISLFLIFGTLFASFAAIYALNLLSLVGYSGIELTDALGVSGSLGFGWPLQVAINILAVYIIYVTRKPIGVLEVFSFVWFFMYMFMAYNKDVMRLAVYFSFGQALCMATRFDDKNVLSGVRYSLLFLLAVQFVSLIYFNAGGIVSGRS